MHIELLLIDIHHIVLNPGAKERPIHHEIDQNRTEYATAH